MTPPQLLTHFDRLAEAPEAVPRLRRFVLDLAVRGKLVPQDAEDEPAEVLLKRIAAEKVRLIQAGQFRKDRSLPIIPEEEHPFELPTYWVWSQLAAIGFINPRNSCEDDSSASFMSMTLLIAEYGVPAQYEVRQWGEIKSGFTHFADGDVVLAKITPCFQNGKSAVMRNMTDGIGAGTTELHVVRPVLVDPDYVVAFLKSPHFIDTGVPRMTGTAGQRRVPTEYFANSPLPLPPLAEQRRIVAKLDELMALCDRLEAAQTEREGRRDRLVRASLTRLNKPDNDAPCFRADARFALDHLPRLATRPEHVAQLRETILNLAVRGKLVPQDPKDEPAPSFGIADDSSDEDRLSLSLPERWSWARVADVADCRLGKMLDKAKNSGEPYPYLRNTNVHWFELRMDELKSLQISDTEIETFLLRKGDVLICEGGHGIGRTAAWRSPLPNVVFQKALHRVRPKSSLASDFIAYCMFVYFHAAILQRYYTGVGIPHFTGVALSKLVFPLPPLAEQRRIVARVDELMAVCDGL
jgi:type I restriction enzyme S subunit